LAIKTMSGSGSESFGKGQTMVEERADANREC